MFHTLSSAEMPSFFHLEGGKTWSWLEIGIRIPIFLVSIIQKNGSGLDEASVRRDLLMSDVKQVIDIFERQSDLLTITDVLLLSPSYMNRRRKGDSFQLNRVKQIWKHTNIAGHTFVLSNGEHLSSWSNRAKKMDLVLNIS